MQRDQLTIDTFTLPPDAQQQLQGYASGLQKEYPEANVALFIIYCFGNRGYRIFPLDKPPIT